MEQTRTYTHLSPEERAAIMLELHHAREDNRPCSIRALARALNRNPSTISRELRRLGDAPYDATLAAIHYRQQRQNSRREPVLVPGTRLYRYVFDRLVYRRWSPQQIAARLRRINDIVRLMNGRPRLALDAQPPDEVMTKVLDDYARPLVALDS